MITTTYTTTYTQETPTSPITLYPYPTIAALTAAGTLRRDIYVTNSLIAVECVGPVWDMPDEIVVRVVDDASGWARVTAPQRAWRLTAELFEQMCERVGKVEAAWGAGEASGGVTIAESDYRVMERRMGRVIELFGKN